MPRTLRLAPLLFLSGACSLVYQAAWMREFRLIFGASTLASAAVTAIFMAGLGVGSWIGGRWVDRHKAPLLLYGNVELTIAVSAALTPLLVPVVRAIYVGVGGSVVLGEAGASLMRLVLSAIILAIPTLGMGATLPAVITAAVNSGEDRRPVGWLYGVNTLGAVCGTLLGTFVLIEIYGLRQTLWMAALVNVLVALVARVLSRTWPGEKVAPTPVEAPPSAAGERGQRVLVGAAAVVGLVFFLMEMVWYRLMGPVLGGTTFTFGLILALALLGIAIGGALHSLLGPESGGTPSTLAVTCLLEAFFLALPFVFADDLAVLAGLLRPLSTFGLTGLAFGWCIVAGAIILPAAVIAGYQFPLLISLLRPRSPGIGSAVALGYAANTAGSIVGALLGGFGLLRLLSAPGAWRFAVLVLGALAVVVLLFAEERPLVRRWRSVGVSTGLLTALLFMMLAPGPSAVWRHSGIGAGRADLLDKTPNELQHWKLDHQGKLLWETDGIESSVALAASDDLVFLVNGKADGSAVWDSGTQVMSGLLAAMSHPSPRRALVIGLGTGSTAGWLASIPQMERVDVIEIEPAIVEVARRASAVNQNVLGNPKVHLIFRDAREVLLASSEKYDLIFSEPSNPYRVGVASLFSNEFYRAVRARLNPDGVFLQWVQGYEIFPETLRTAMATLGSVFPDVETWQTRLDDLVFAASEKPRQYDVATLRARAASEPFRSALDKAWRVEGAEGYLAYFVAGPGLVKAVAAEEQGDINTDDHPILEYGFARSVGRSHRLSVQALRESARSIQADRPLVRGELDWERVEQVRMELRATWGRAPTAPSGASEETRRLSRFLAAYRAGNMPEARRELEPMLGAIRGPIQTRLAAEVLVQTQAPQADEALRRLATYQPLVSGVLGAKKLAEAGDNARALSQLEAVLRELPSGDPWQVQSVLNFAAPLTVRLARKDSSRVAELTRLLEKPFPVYGGESVRRWILVGLAEIDPASCGPAFSPFEPFPIWEEKPLALRFRCYQRMGSPLAAQARQDLARYQGAESRDFHLRDAPAERPESVSTAREEKEGAPPTGAQSARSPEAGGDQRASPPSEPPLTPGTAAAQR
jgi:spermidine synthase